MLFSRTLAKRRIAIGERPSRRAAWTPVAADTLCAVLVVALLWQPLLTLVYVAQLSLPGTILLLLVVIYAPVQIVIVVATIWAIKSRYAED